MSSPLERKKDEMHEVKVTNGPVLAISGGWFWKPWMRPLWDGRHRDVRQLNNGPLVAWLGGAGDEVIACGN